jgi:carboxyl-terminal processing protease
LKVFENKLDDDVKLSNLDFHYLIVNIFKEALVKAEGYYQEAIHKSFDFKKNQSFELNPEKLKYAASDAALKSYWNALIQYEIESRVAEKLDGTGKQ